MHEHRSAQTSASDGESSRLVASSARQVAWRHGLSVLNLRGNPDDPAFLSGVQAALVLALPTRAGSTSIGQALTAVWAGPDDWFILGPANQACALERALRANLSGQPVAVTDVSSGYTLLSLSGPGARPALAQGCPLDLHPRAFGPGQAAGTHYFKASVWLWQVDDQPLFEVLVRRSFMDYVGLMLERSHPDWPDAGGADAR